MTRTVSRLAALALAVGVASTALAAPAAPPASGSAAHAAPAAARPARTTSVTRMRPPADTSGHTRPRVAPRTLDDIHIEGEIPVPQVLFITAREQRRFMEFQHHRYQRTSLELGRTTPTPARIVVTSPSTAERKEIKR